MIHIEHLSKDKKFKKILAQQKPFVLKRRRNVHLHLCNSIMSQQLNTKVAEVFQQRFIALFDGNEPTPKQIADTSFETLRNIGLSNAKANYVLNVSRFFMENKITDAQLYKMENEKLTEFLTQIKGVGKWTTEMILMFSLGREDVFAVDDLGIQQAMCKLYDIDVADKKAMKQQMILISENWKPYRTYACRYLWGWKDGD